MKYRKWYQIIYLAIAVAAFYYVAKKLITFEQWDYVSGRYINDNWLILGVVQIVLWGLNIGLESMRWQNLLSSFTRIDFSKSVQMVLMGFTTGSISPMKIGEPGGKILFLKKEERPTGVLASVYGSYLNSAVLFLLTLLIFPLALSAGLIDISVTSNLSAFSYVILALCILAASYFIIYYFFKQIKKKVRNTRWAVKTGFFKNFRLKKFMTLFLYTLLRVMVYNFQLYIWFMFFNIPDIGINFMLLSPLYFAAITLIPAMFLFDLGIRGSVGVFVFSVISENLGAVLSALFFLWFFNVALPVLWGSLLLISNKYSKKQGKNIHKLKSL